MATNRKGEAIDLLRKSSIDVVFGTADRWDLKLAGPRVVSRMIHELGRRLTLVQAMTWTPGTLLLAQTADSRGLEQLRRLGADAIVLNPPTVIIEGQDRLGGEGRGKVTTVARGRPASRRWAVLRALLVAGAPLDQRELAHFTGLTQQSISRILRDLQGQVERGRDGWILTSWDRSLQDWLDAYPGPGGTSTWWYGLDDPQTQTRDACALATELDAEPLVGGDVAVDHYAPWRTPRTARLYTRTLVDLVPAGFSPASAADGTLEVVVPDDTSLWRTATGVDGTALIDPIIALWETAQSTATDAAEAFTQLLTRLATGHDDG